MRNALLTAGVLSILVPALGAQDDSSADAFEVASVRPVQGATMIARMDFRPGRFSVSGFTLSALIAEAYNIPEYRISGGPVWAEAERFDIAANAPEDATRDHLRGMLQALLRDRFSLVTHREIREGRVYELVLANGDGRLGPRLTRPDGTADCERIVAARRAAFEDALRTRGVASVVEGGFDFGEGPACEQNSFTRELSGGVVAYSWISGRRPMAHLVEYLSEHVDRPVLDRTGLMGEFDFRLEFVQRPAFDTDTPAVSGGPELFPALQEQLGLTLNSGRGPVEVLVIDEVARPDPN
jgi:uncharacterized protein (TIGR03435 family)